MPKRRQILLVLAAGALLIGLYAIFSSPPEPSYQGRKLSQWVEDYPVAATSTSEDEQKVVAAIRHMGTNALPHLIKWMQWQQPAWRRGVLGGRTGYKIGQLAPWLVAEERRGVRAWRVILALGSDLNVAIPQLLRLMADEKAPQTAEFAASVLARIGTPEAYEAIRGALTKEHKWVHATLISYIQPHDTNAIVLLPALIQELRNPDPGLSQAAARKLQQFNASTNAQPAGLGE